MIEMVIILIVKSHLEIKEKQDSKDLNPRSLAKTPQSLNSTNALKISTSSNAPETFKVYKCS
jgi:hypothetical protein